MAGGPVATLAGPGTALPVGADITLFVVAAVASLGASGILVRRLERVGARLGLAEAALGMFAALAANTPEITSAVTALARGERQIGAGVVLGSNVFNLAALLGVGAVVAGRIALHRRVVALAGTAALWLALVALGAMGSVFGAGIGLALAAVVFVPYVAVSGWPELRHRLPLPARAVAWLEQAVREEEAELAEAIHPTVGSRADVVAGAVALAVVVAASVVMERSASGIGTHYRVSHIVVGAVVLAAVTSLPNAVAAVYLARRGRAVAVLSEALNSNNLNVVVGLLVPATFLGLGRPGGPGVVTAAFALAMTALGLALASSGGGMRRGEGALLVAGYLAFVVVVGVIG